MAKPIVSAERVRELFHYDPNTGIFIRRVTRNHNCKAGDVAGCLSRAGYLHIGIDNRNYYGHRLAWCWVHGAWPSDEIDHKNGVRSDNRISNLREATSGENRQNIRRAMPHSSSGVLGVTMDRRDGRWSSKIQVNGETRSLGRFDSAELAHAEYLRAKARWHSFGTLDCPDGDMRDPRVHSSGFLGVSWSKQKKRWKARIRIDGKRVHLGSFPTAELAHAAYVTAKRELHPMGML